MIDIILFDLGGVLVELTGVQTMIEWTDQKYSVDELWEVWLSSPAVRSFEKGCATVGQFADGIIEEMSLPVGKTEFISAFTQWPRGLFPGVSSLLKSLKKQFTLACLSNSNELHWPRLMAETGLDEMLDYHFASHLMGRIKPDPESFEYVLQRLNCKASSVLFLDDNEINVASAREIGMVAQKVNGPTEIRKLFKGTDIFNNIVLS